MKSFSVLFYVASSLFSSFVSAQSWVPQDSNTSNDLRSVHFVSNQKGFAGGHDGLMMRTFNGGITWDSLNKFALRTITDIYFLTDDPQKGWAASTVLFQNTGNNISVTTNGGNSWASKPSAVSRSVFGIHIAVNKGAQGIDGWIVGEDGGGRYIRRENGTTNSFATIVPVNGGGNKPLRGIHAASLTTALAVGEEGTILKSGNSVDAAWNVVSSPTSNNLNDVYFATQQLALIVGANGTILRSVNGGTSWAAVNSSVSDHLYAVHFTNALQGWAVGSSGTILYSSNGGQTWSKQNSNSTNDLYDVFFANDSTGWAVGNQGAILKYSKEPFYLISVNAPCRGDTLFLSVNGVSGDTYLWSHPNGFSSTLREPVIPNIQHGGTYTVIVTRPSGTAVTISVEVVLKEGPQINLSNVGPLPCGTAGRTVGVSSQPPGASFTWFDAQGNELGTQSSQNFQLPGNYRVRAIQDGCTTDSIFVIEPPADGPPITLTMSNSQLTCLVDSIFATVQTGPWTFVWTGDGKVLSETAEVILTKAGSYYLRVTDIQNLCFTDTSIVITEDRVAPVIGDLDVPIIDCSTAPKVLQLKTPLGGVDYRWFKNSAEIGSGMSLVVQQSGVYRLVASNPHNGCTSDRLIQVNEDSIPPQIDGFQLLTDDCEQGIFSLGAIVSGAVQTWAWARGGVIVSSSERVSPLQPGIYAITVTGLNSCTVTTSREVTQGELMATGTLSHQLEWLDCPTGRARIHLTLKEKQGEVVWQDASGGQIGNGLSVEVSAKGSYNALVVWEGGCETAYQVLVSSVVENLLATVITPNDDGRNDRLVFDFCGEGNLSPPRLTVFNRWGQKVYHADAYNNDWPTAGSLNLPTGQYYYILEWNNLTFRRPLTVLHD